VEIRPIATSDASAVLDFVCRLPKGERTFLRDDLSSVAEVEGWIHGGNSRRLAALDEEVIVGLVSVTPRIGWSSHVGELRLAVDPSLRRKGLGRTLARRILVEALSMKLAKIVVEAVADQQHLAVMFQGLGFQPEALLSDHVRDREGNLHHLLVLSHSIDSVWPALSVVGIDDELGRT